VVPPLPGLSPDALAPLLTVEPDYLAAAWDLAAREHGSVGGYLVACGVTTPVRDALVARLVASSTGARGRAGHGRAGPGRGWPAPAGVGRERAVEGEPIET